MPTNREEFFRMFDIPKDASLSLEEIAALSQTPLGALREVYNRGIGAWKTNIASVRLKSDFSKNPDIKKSPRSARLGKEQWAYARVYAFVMGSKGTYEGADKDIAIKYGIYFQ